MMVVMVALRFINFSHIDGDCDASDGGDGEDSERVVLHKVNPPHCQLLSHSSEWQSQSVLLVNNVKHEMTFCMVSHYSKSFKWPTKKLL